MEPALSPLAGAPRVSKLASSLVLLLRAEGGGLARAVDRVLAPTRGCHGEAGASRALVTGGATTINGMAMWPFIDGRMVEEW